MKMHFVLRRVWRGVMWYEYWCSKLPLNLGTTDESIATLRLYLADRRRRLP